MGITVSHNYCKPYQSEVLLIVKSEVQSESRAAARLVSLSPKFCHITPVLMSLHWLPIDLRIEFKILIITYKTLHGLAPAYIEDLLVSYIPGRYLRSAKKNLLAVPGFKLNSYGRRAFSVAAPLLWNSLPQHVRDAESLDIFKRQLKTVLFKRAFLN